MFNLKTLVVGLVALGGIIGFVNLVKPQDVSLGGLVHTLQEDFTAGIRVGGQEVISAARAFTPATLTVPGTTLIGDSTTGLNYYLNFVAPSADVTLTAAQSGSVIKMAVAGLDVTTPAPAAGLHYRFVVTAAVATTNMTVVAGTADTIEGTLIVAGAVVDCDASDLITFVIDGENIGDYVDLYSDGTSWLIGSSGALTAAKMTCSG